jgi:hypothetical protein
LPRKISILLPGMAVSFGARLIRPATRSCTLV